MTYKPPYKITPKIIDLVSKISEALGSFYAQEELRLHRINRIKTIQGSLAIEGNTLTLDQITAILDGKHVMAPINQHPTFNTRQNYRTVTQQSQDYTQRSCFYIGYNL